MKTIIYSIIFICIANLSFGQQTTTKNWNEAITETCIKKFLHLDENADITHFSIAVAHGTSLEAFPHSDNETCNEVFKKLHDHLISIKTTHDVNMLVGDLEYVLNGEKRTKDNFIIKIEGVDEFASR